MRIEIEEIEIYTFSESSRELKDKIINRFSDGDLYEHCFLERISTLKALAEVLDGQLEYSLSCVPDRRDYIYITPTQDDSCLEEDELDFQALWDKIDVEKSGPLTGCCYDHDIIDHLSKYNLNGEALQTALNLFIESIHEEYQSMLTDEYIGDLCEANSYEFTLDGKIYS